MMGLQSGLAAYLLFPLLLLIAIAQAQTQCQGKDDLSTFTQDGIEYEVHCNTDLQVGNLDETDDETFEDCAAACDSYTANNPNEPCVAAVLSSEASGNIGCNLKAEIDNQVESADFDSIFRITPIPPNECFGKANGTIFTEGGLLYEVYCDYDVFEFDADGTGPGEDNTFESCAALCTANPNCLAVVAEELDDGTIFCHVKESVEAQGPSDVFSVAFLISPRNVDNITSSATSATFTPSASIGTSATVGTTSSVAFPNTTSLEISSPTISVPGTVTSASFVNSTTAVSSTESSIEVTSLTSSVGTSVPVITSSPAGSVSPSESVTLSSSGLFTNSSSVTGPITSATGTVTSGTGVSTTNSAPASTSSAAGNSPFFAIRITLTIGLEVYVSADGTLVADFNLAAVFEIVSGQLYQIVGGQRILRRALGGQIKAQPGVDRLLFAPSTADSGVFITTLFVFPGFFEELIWDNTVFFGGSAGYCVLDNALYATFDEDTSFCDQIAPAIVVPVPTASGTVSSAIASPTGPTTIINNYNNVTIYNNIEYNFNIDININIFAGGNYAPADGDFFYAILCPVCPPVKVHKSDLTYAQVPCPVCKPEIHKLESASPPKVAGPTTCTYGESTCLTCKAPKVPLAVVAAPCPVCPGKTTNLVCPSSAASSIKEIASTKGPAAAASAAKSAITLTVTQTVAPSKAAEVAPSTVANVPCPTCPAGSVAVTLPQVAATGAPEAQPGAPEAQPGAPEAQPGAPEAQPGAPEKQPAVPAVQPGAPEVQPAAPKAQPSSGLTPPVADFKGAASLSAPLTTGFVLVASFVALIVYL